MRCAHRPASAPIWLKRLAAPLQTASVYIGLGRSLRLFQTVSSLVEGSKDFQRQRRSPSRHSPLMRILLVIGSPNPQSERVSPFFTFERRRRILTDCNADRHRLSGRARVSREIRPADSRPTSASPAHRPRSAISAMSAIAYDLAFIDCLDVVDMGVDQRAAVEDVNIAAERRSPPSGAC